jgi:hypothetical protein
MSKTPDNNNANAGRQTGKSAGRPVRVSSVKKEEKPAAGKKRSRPAKKPPQKKVPKQNVKVETPSGIPDDFAIPKSFFDHMGDPRFQDQLNEYTESMLRTNADFLPTANDISLANPLDYQSALANWHSGVARYLPVRISWLAAVAQMIVERSIQPKVECTYGPNGQLKSKKITSGKGDSGALATMQSLLEMEMKWAEKMKPAQTDKLVLDVPAGGDVRKHKIVELMRRRLEVLEKQKASVVVESPSTAG